MKVPAGPAQQAAAGDHRDDRHALGADDIQEDMA
jgi:hypothetical protein